MIKIISGHSGPGGSTTAFVNLTNTLNSFGYDTTFYGPHEYHLSKCKSDMLNNFTPQKTDSVIVHYLSPPKLNVKKQILSCHETVAFSLNNRDLSMYSKVHYVSRWQQEWHKVSKSYFILPNILEDLKPNSKPKQKVGGVIGTVFAHKQTHLSVIKALDDSCDIVYIYGNIGDYNYFENSIKPLLCSKVVYMGQEENKQKMYDSITDVYQDSVSETWGYVKGECQLTNTNYHYNDATNYFWKLDNKEIVERWIKELSV